MKVKDFQGAVARMQERSKGKDTTIGHWEIAGLVSPKPLPTFPEGFRMSCWMPLKKKRGEEYCATALTPVRRS